MNYSQENSKWIMECLNNWRHKAGVYKQLSESHKQCATMFKEEIDRLRFQADNPRDFFLKELPNENTNR